MKTRGEELLESKKIIELNKCKLIKQIYFRIYVPIRTLITSEKNRSIKY